MFLSSASKPSRVPGYQLPARLPTPQRCRVLHQTSSVKGQRKNMWPLVSWLELQKIETMLVPLSQSAIHGLNQTNSV